MDPNKEAEVVQMHQQGMKATAIAVELEISPSAVRAVLRKNAPPVPIKVLDEDAIVEAYLGSVPVADILKEHGTSYATLYKVLAAHDVQTRAAISAPGRQKQLEAAVALYKSGSPLWTILQETGISQPVLHNELHKQGITLRRPRIL